MPTDSLGRGVPPYTHRRVGGPSGRASLAPVAQWIEHSPSKRNVAGSIPAWGTNTNRFNDSGLSSGSDRLPYRFASGGFQ